MVARSEPLFSPTASWRQIAAAGGRAPAGAITLSPAEQAVARCLRAGLTNKEIAALLGKSERTVKNQVHAILVKSGLPTRARYIAAGIA
jgi:DNA-binding NarL/FixJ family response regulator